MSLRNLTDFVESKVPLLPTETAHQWQMALLKGCCRCGTHEGYECTGCLRAVDEQCDPQLAAAIGLIVASQALGDMR